MPKSDEKVKPLSMEGKGMEIKTCPFCGNNEAKFQHYDVLENGEVGEFCGIRCQYCGINFFTDGKESETIKSWNHRHP